MKKYLLTIAGCLAIFVGLAKELSDGQLELRRDIYHILKANGYKDADIDEDGDLFFKIDDTIYWVEINSNWEDPYLVSLNTGFPYGVDNFTREEIEGCISLVNKLKTVKLHCGDSSYTFRSDIICDDAEQFRQTFKAILDEELEAQNRVVTLVSYGLAGLDLTGDKDTLFTNALLMFAQEQQTGALLLFNYLADQGHALSHSMLGLIYENGEIVPKDEAKMVEHYEKAIEGGETWCAYELGDYYYLNSRYPEALEYYTVASANDNTHRSEAYYAVGMMNEKGLGTEKNLTQAIRNYRKSVEYADELESDARLALMRLGEQIESPSDFTDISPSMLAGMTAEQMYNKGYEYEHGNNNRNVSLPKAYGYYKAAAERNHTKALLKMGEIYISQYYPFKDKSKSDKSYAKAVKALKQQEGYSGDANYQLGMLYKEGRGVDKKPELSMDYFRRASNKGVADADYELGLIYQKELEYVDAFRYFLKSAENDCPAAMLEVAKAYQSGHGIAKNKSQAISWYTKCKDTQTPYSKAAAEALRNMGITE